MDNLDKMYRRRFSKDEGFRKAMYGVLCSEFYSRYVPENSLVLDVAAGYCEFINAIKAEGKIAVDANPDVKRHAAKGVRCIVSKSSDMGAIKSGSVDVVFVSNFFEHLPKEEIVLTIREIRRVLKVQGKLLVLQPNIRYAYKDYWMFFDHITPLDDRSLCEALEVNGFEIVECIPRFLPYTTKGSLPKSLLLLRAYLKIPLLWRLFGQQAFVVARKK